MSRFGNLSTEGLEQTEDRVGGFAPLDTDAYPATIKMAYAIESAGGAQGVVFMADINGREYRETVYVTNKKGENFFLNKDDKTKKVPLPGFTVMNDICLVTCEKELSEMVDEEKVVNIYDFDAKRDVPKSVSVLTELLGKQVVLGIQKNLENKSDKVGDEYVPNADTRDTNNIVKVFHHPSLITVVEARNEITEPKFHEAWTAKNKGVTNDKRTIKDGQAGTTGRPGARANAGAPQAGATTGAPKKSLFGGGS